VKPHRLAFLQAALSSGQYLPTDTGEIISYKKNANGKPLPQVSSRGYRLVTLWSKGTPMTFQVHQIVVTYFLGAIPEGMQVNHIDGVRHNNNIANLEIVTPGQNIKHSYTLGLRDKKGEANHYASLSNDDVIEIRRRYAAGEGPQWKIAQKFQIHQATVSDIVNRVTWRHV
jgi:hypothetical protein